MSKRIKLYCLFLLFLTAGVIIVVLLSNITSVDDIIKVEHLEERNTYTDSSNVRVVYADSTPAYNTFRSKLSGRNALDQELNQLGLMYSDFDIVSVEEVDQYLYKIYLQCLFYDRNHVLMICNLTVTCSHDFEITKYEYTVEEVVDEDV